MAHNLQFRILFPGLYYLSRVRYQDCSHLRALGGVTPTFFKARLPGDPGLPDLRIRVLEDKNIDAIFDTWIVGDPDLIEQFYAAIEPVSSMHPSTVMASTPVRGLVVLPN